MAFVHFNCITDHHLLTSRDFACVYCLVAVISVRLTLLLEFLVLVGVVVIATPVTIGTC